MKLYRKKFLFVIIAFGFITIFGWSIITSFLSSSEQNVGTNGKVLLKQSDAYSVSTEGDSKNEVELPKKSKHTQNSTNSERRQLQSNKVRNIQCRINGEYAVNCISIHDSPSNEASVYIPFSLIHKYFEINGKLVAGSKNQYFEWSHSYSKIFYPDEPYNPIGKFLWFVNYNVEIRERVKCISAIEDVPITTQWYAKGHFYPTQISQYGLSHFNKNLSEPMPKQITLFQDGHLIANCSSQPEILALQIADEGFLHIEGNNKTTIYLPANDAPNYLIIDTNLRINSNSTISIYIADLSNQQEFALNYATIDSHLLLSPKTAVYGLGSKRINSVWFQMTRNLLVDLFKGGLISNRKRSNNYRIVRIEFYGKIDIRKLSILTAAHDRFARAAGEWLVRNQNSLGGWDIKVKRRLQKSTGGTLILKEGWHSAMAQGQAISLLTRLYSVTEEAKYLDAAKKALAVFEVESFKNGVKAMFFDKYVWYEEYPTVPSIFVLNGFIYSLFGLYDLSKMCNEPVCQKSGQLFEDGIRSLEAMLPMYDSGSGSFYDLRHYSLANAPNVARWDYHSTHINQLLHLYTIVRRDIFQTTAERWVGYMKGKRAPHN